MTTNRRRFLKTTLGTTAVLSLGGTVPEYLLQAADSTESQGDTILVVLQLSGGNDGLNTVIPYTDPDYYRSRPKLAVAKDDALAVDGQLGLHPAARGLADLLEAGQLGIVQGVGYENPNRSHFESMDIWHSCRRKGAARNDGWLGRYFDAAHLETGGDPPAIHLGGEKQPLALAARRVRVPSIASLNRFRLQQGDEQLRAAIAELASDSQAKSDDLLGFIQSSTNSALQASQRVEEARRDYRTPVAYPQHALAEKLKTIAQLIDAELETRVYYTQLDGFDTHSQQAGAHASLLNQLGGSLSAFVRDLQHHGHVDRVLVMVFSEFGRRVQENASEGTDHGAAAPIFLAGGHAQPGPLGEHPSLTDLQDGDLKHHTDFREVYAAVLEHWLGWPSHQILDGQFEAAKLFRDTNSG